MIVMAHAVTALKRFGMKRGNNGTYLTVYKLFQ